jgi:hypothetical protein
MDPTPGKLSGTIANLFTDVEITEIYGCNQSGGQLCTYWRQHCMKENNDD